MALIWIATTAVLQADARKTYLVKDQIRSGEIEVYQPRVQATDAEWCVFKEAGGDNYWCIEAAQRWTAGVYNEYEYTTATRQYRTLDPPTGFFRHNLMFNST